MNEVYTKNLEDEFDSSEGALPFGLQQMAKDELGETPQRRKKSLALLLRLLSEDKDLNPRKDLHFLLRFLRVRKYNVEAALRTVQKYYRIRHASGPVFKDFLPSKVSPATRKLMIIMPDKDAHGRPILLLKFGSWMPEESTYVEGHRAIMLCLEHLAKDPVTQTFGLTLFVDYEGWTLDKILRTDIGLIRRMVEYVQECTPMRLKVAHVVRHGAAFDMLFALVRPFLKKKFVERIRLHGDKFDDLHKEIYPSVLPQEYGGQAPPLDFDGFWRDFESHDDDYREDSSYGYLTKSDIDFATEAEIEEELSFL